MKYLVYIFYVEAAISTLSGTQALLMPESFLRQFSAQPITPLALELTRWYGVLIFVLLYLLIQGLRQRGAGLKLALQALLFGDFLQIGATFVSAKALGEWSLAFIMSVVLSAIFIVVRSLCLWKPQETGIE